MDIICLIFDELLKFLKYLYSLGPSLAPWATVAGVFMIFLALRTIRSNNTTKRMELISKIYGRFLEDELYGFHIRIRYKEVINWQHDKNDERLLNKSLTLFDEVNYLRTQRLLDKKAWEYVASEIQYFALNASVWDYMIHRIIECKDSGFPDDIIPFTGFPDLLKKIPPQFRVKPFPIVPDRYNALINPGGWQKLWIVISDRARRNAKT